MIGVIGGYGNIGKEVVKLLQIYEVGAVTVGSRWQHHQAVPWCYADIEDEASLLAFMKQHQVVINTAGPSSVLSLQTAACAIKAGCHLIDCGFHPGIAGLTTVFPEQSVLSGMGTVPGFSELLPLVLQKEFAGIEQFQHFYNITGRFTKTAAIDFIAGVFSSFGRSAAPANAVPDLAKIQPFFPAAIRIMPYQSAETALLGDRGSWYQVICGSKMNQFYQDLLKRYVQNRGRLEEELCLAAELDSLMIPEQVTFLVDIQGFDQYGQRQQRSDWLRAPGQAQLSAAFAVAVCEVLLAGGIEPGVGGINKIRNPAQVLEQMLKYQILTVATQVSAALTDQEEGVL